MIVLFQQAQHTMAKSAINAYLFTTINYDKKEFP